MDDDGAMDEIQLLVTGPADEANLYELLGGTFDHHNTHQVRLPLSSDPNMGYELDAFNGDGAKAAPDILTAHEMEDYLEPSMLGCFLAPWRCGPRGTRTRRRSSWRVEVGKLFGSHYRCTSGSGKCRRKNNDHWTEDEMIELVDAVSKKGIGKWSRVKDDYFSTSSRTAVHLKDKWRNLVTACNTKYTTKKIRKAKKTSQNKVSVQKATELVVEKLGHQILAAEAKHLSQKKK